MLDFDSFKGCWTLVLALVVISLVLSRLAFEFG